MNLKAVWGLLKTSVGAWSRDNAPRLGAALSYYTIFALSPLFVIVIFVASLLFDSGSVRGELLAQVGSVIGKKGADAINAMLGAAAPQKQGVVASIIAIATLILSATGLFMELQNDLNSIWGVEQKPGQGLWSFIRNRLLSFAMVVGIGFLLLVSLVVSTTLAALGKYIAGLVPGLDVVWMILNISVAFLVITVLFAMVFKVLPDVKIAWRDVWIGAAITAMLFTGGKFLLGLYLGRSSTVSAYGAAGSLVLILLWVYYSAQILFLGAEFTRAYANRFGRRLQPTDNAKWVRPPNENLEPLPPGKPRSDRKAQLVSELRQEVAHLRTQVHRQPAYSHGRAAHSFYAESSANKPRNARKLARTASNAQAD